MSRPCFPSMKQMRDSRATTSSSPRCTTEGSMFLTGRVTRPRLMRFRGHEPVGYAHGSRRVAAAIRGNGRRVASSSVRDGGGGPEGERGEQQTARDQEDEPEAPEQGEDPREAGSRDGRAAAEGAV